MYCNIYIYIYIYICTIIYYNIIDIILHNTEYMRRTFGWATTTTPGTGPWLRPWSST